MTEFALTLGRPARADDCVPEPLLPMVRLPLWVAVLTLRGRPLADLNDDPELEDQYDAGVGHWVRWVPELLGMVARRSGTPLVQAAASPLRAQTRSKSHATWQWTVEHPATLNSELLEGLATYGNVVMVWTSRPAGQIGGDDAGSPSSVTTVNGWIQNGTLPWWVAHGYKEPFLVGYTPDLSADSLATLIRAELGITVELAPQPFVPHRVRVHRRSSAR